MMITTTPPQATETVIICASDSDQSLTGKEAAFQRLNTLEVKPMPNIERNMDQKRLDFAKETIQLFGDKIEPNMQAAILNQKVILGMSPYEARLAAGAYFFKVEADPMVWPPNTDPNIVIEKQAIRPDESKIWLTFETSTQFTDGKKQRFQVYFLRGKAAEITRLVAP